MPASDDPSQHLPSYLGFSYLGRGVSLHGRSSKAQPLFLTLDEGYLLTAAPPDFEHGVAPLGPPAPWQPLPLEPGVAPLCRRPKDDAVKVLHSICQQIWKTQQWSQDWKRSVLIPTPKKGNPKECSNYRTIALISNASRVMVKILQAGFSNTWTVNFQMCKLVLEKAKVLEIKLSTSAGSSKEQESSRKTPISALLTMPKPLSVWITINCGKLWKSWEYQTMWPASWETCMQVRKPQLELDVEQQTGSK